LITDEHIKAADSYRLAYDVARFGLSRDPDQRGGSASRGPRSGPTDLDRARVVALEQFRECTTTMGFLTQDLLTWVVLGNSRIAKYIEHKKATSGIVIRPDVGMGLLVGGLDHLVRYPGRTLNIPFIPLHSQSQFEQRDSCGPPRTSGCRPRPPA
jgi:hypothetical protein